MRVLHIVILVLALIALLKGGLLLFLPDASRRFVAWWAGLPGAGLRFLGALAILIGVVLIGLAVAAMRDPVIGTATIVGTLFVVGGMLYQWPPVVTSVMKPFGAEGRPWVMRLAGVVAVAVAVVLFVILFLSRHAS